MNLDWPVSNASFDARPIAVISATSAQFHSHLGTDFSVYGRRSRVGCRAATLLGASATPQRGGLPLTDGYDREAAKADLDVSLTFPASRALATSVRRSSRLVSQAVDRRDGRDLTSSSRG